MSGAVSLDQRDFFGQGKIRVFVMIYVTGGRGEGILVSREIFTCWLGFGFSSCQHNTEVLHFLNPQIQFTTPLVNNKGDPRLWLQIST
jgi:hypothetical protein